MPVIEAKDLDVAYYGDISILKSVSMQAEQGQITAVIGPNGAGKSTLLKALYGLLKPRTGAVYLRGTDIKDFRVHDLMRQGVAYVPQLRSIFPDLTVEENLELGAWIFKRDTRKVRFAVERTYERFPFLAEKRKTAGGLLSGGQQKMLEIGRSLMTEPAVCLLDEPTATISPKIAGQIYSTLADLKSEGIAIVMVDQRVRQAFEISDYVYVLELGRNKMAGSREEFQQGLQDVIRGWLD